MKITVLRTQLTSHACSASSFVENSTKANPFGSPVVLNLGTLTYTTLPQELNCCLIQSWVTLGGRHSCNNKKTNQFFCRQVNYLKLVMSGCESVVKIKIYFIKKLIELLKTIPWTSEFDLVPSKHNYSSKSLDIWRSYWICESKGHLLFYICDEIFAIYLGHYIVLHFQLTT